MEFDSFDSFYKNQNRKMGHFHKKSRSLRGVTGINRSTGQNLIPEYKRVDRSKVDVVERLKNTKHQRVSVTPKQVEAILRYYNVVDIVPGKPKKLGKTGVTLNMIDNKTYFLTT